MAKNASSTKSRLCNSIPSACIYLQTLAMVALAGVLGYVFVTQELFK